MIFGKTVGTVVSTVRSDEIDGAAFLLVRQCSHTGEPMNNYHVALDVVQAGPGEMVLLSQGSSCRQTGMSYRKPVDAVIIGIIDSIEERGTIVFRK